MIRVGVFNTPFSIMDRSPRLRINKVRTDLSNTIDKIDLTDIYRTFYPTTEYTFFSSTQEHFLE